MSRAETCRERLDEVATLAAALRDDEEVVARVGEVAGMTVSALRNGGKLLLCGNGGSAADAQHLAGELLGRFMLERKPYPAVALADNVAAATAIANDCAYEEIFARGVEGHGAPGDVLYAFTTSGTSTNVLLALSAAHDRGLKTVAFVGRDPSAVATLADVTFAVAGSSTARIQELHKVLGHVIIELVERELEQGDDDQSTAAGPTEPSLDADD